jgi:hypothetical protein
MATSEELAGMPRCIRLGVEGLARTSSANIEDVIVEAFLAEAL